MTGFENIYSMGIIEVTEAIAMVAEFDRSINASEQKNVMT